MNDDSKNVGFFATHFSTPSANASAVPIRRGSLRLRITSTWRQNINTPNEYRVKKKNV